MAFDARKAINSIDIDDSSLTAGQDITIEGKTESTLTYQSRALLRWRLYLLWMWGLLSQPQI